MKSKLSVHPHGLLWERTESNRRSGQTYHSVARRYFAAYGLSLPCARLFGLSLNRQKVISFYLFE